MSDLKIEQREETTIDLEKRRREEREGKGAMDKRETVAPYLIGITLRNST